MGSAVYLTADAQRQRRGDLAEHFRSCVLGGGVAALTAATTANR